MTISVASLFEQSGLQRTGVVRWGTPPPVTGPGDYVVASTAHPNDAVGLIDEYKPNAKAFTVLRLLCPDVGIDGRAASDQELAARIGRFGIPATPILYIGRAGTSVQNRVKQYYTTDLGRRSPHAGGWWLKTMADLHELQVHFAPAVDPDAVKARLLSTFRASVPESVSATLYDPERVAPFANVAVTKGVLKRHDLNGYKVARTTTPKSLDTRTPHAGEPELTQKPSLAIEPATVVNTVDTVGMRIESQVFTDGDRNRSHLRIPSPSKYALPASDGFVEVLQRQQFDARWRINGSRHRSRKGDHVLDRRNWTQHLA